MTKIKIPGCTCSYLVLVPLQKKKKSPEKNSVILFEMFVARINSHRTSLDEGYRISYLRLRILVLAIGVSVLTWLGGLDTGRI